MTHHGVCAGCDTADTQERFRVVNKWIMCLEINIESYVVECRYNAVQYSIILYTPLQLLGYNLISPDSKVLGANMRPIWGRQDPGGPHVGPIISELCYLGELELTKYNPCITLTGELWGVFCEDSGECWSRYNTMVRTIIMFVTTNVRGDLNCSEPFTNDA